MLNIRTAFVFPSRIICEHQNIEQYFGMETEVHKHLLSAKNPLFGRKSNKSSLLSFTQGFIYVPGISNFWFIIGGLRTSLL
jgi:hypothetical protein